MTAIRRHSAKPGRVALFAAAAAACVTFGAAPAKAVDAQEFFAAPDRAGLLPIETIVKKTRRAVRGTIDEVELERNDDGLWIYKAKVFTPNGQKVKLVFDAKTGKLLRETAKTPSFWD